MKKAEWRERFDKKFVNPKTGKFYIERWGDYEAVCFKPKDIKQFISQEIKREREKMGKALKMVEMDNRPEITEWLFCKNRDEANGFNIAVKELNQVIDNYLERKE